MECASQNLVPNGGFEDGVDGCPTIIGGITDECAHWYASITAHPDSVPTPDWFHECSEQETLSPPDIAFGNQAPFEGEGYSGLVTFAGPFSDYREIIGVALNEPLEIGMSYLVKFKYVFTSNEGNEILSSNLGFNFSTHAEYSLSGFPTNTSHYYIDSIIPQSSEWQEISIDFAADSSYTHFHIGNFFDDQNTDTALAGLASYFLIDDVSITSTLNTQTSPDFHFYDVYPNPTRNFIYVKFQQAIKANLTVYNMQGGVMFSNQLNHQSGIVILDMESLSSGHYILRIETLNFSSYERIIKM
jgi:hypothetical protein